MITTPAQLNAMSIGSAVRDVEGDTWELTRTGWFCADFPYSGRVSAYTLFERDLGPFTDVTKPAPHVVTTQEQADGFFESTTKALILVDGSPTLVWRDDNGDWWGLRPANEDDRADGPVEYIWDDIAELPIVVLWHDAMAHPTVTP